MIILVYSFRICSTRLIGRVRFRLPSNTIFFGFGIGKILPCFHTLGMSLFKRQRLNKAVSAVMHVEPKCFIISWLIPVGPQALPFGSLEIV